MTGLALLFYEFFKIGLFAVGGGLATLPFLYKLAEKYDWFTNAMIADMIAVSESTPGPLGVNMATYTGFQHNGMVGSFVATFALVLPSVIIVIIISKFLKKFRDSPIVEQVFYTIRPTVTGMIGAAGFGVIIHALFQSNGIALTSISAFASSVRIKECILFIVVFILTNKWEKHPILYISAGAVIGILFQF